MFFFLSFPSEETKKIMMDWDEDSDEEHPAGSAEKQEQVPNNEVNFQLFFNVFLNSYIIILY